MKFGPEIRRNGLALIQTLLAVSVIIVVVLSLLSLVTPWRASNHAYKRNYHYDLALESALQDGLGQVLHATNRDHFLTHMVTDEEGETQYYVISWFDSDESQWVHQPLVAGVSAQKLGFKGMYDGYAKYSGGIDVGVNPMEMDDLGWQLGGIKRLSLTTPRIELGNGLSYSYWIEDLNGLLDYEALAHEGNNERLSYDPYLTSKEQQQRAEAKIIDQRHLGLNVFSSGLDGQHEFPVDYDQPFTKRLQNPNGAGAPPEHPFAPLFAQEFPAYMASESTVLSEISTDYEALRGAFTFRLADTIESEVVPYGHNYENAGEPKMNLNAELSSGKVAVQRVATRIKKVRGFKDNAEEYGAVGIYVNPEFPSEARYGGFPVETESYCATLAANILDYADAGSVPRVERGLTSGNYRGIDAYPYYTEASRRYYLSDATEQGVVIQIRNFIELHNPTNQTLHGYLKFNLYPDQDHKIIINGAEYPLPLEELFYWGGLITIEPNKYRVLELTQDLDDDFIGDEEAYLHYELADSSGTATASRTASEGNRMEIWWCSIDNSEEDPPSDISDFSLVGGVVHGSFNIADTGRTLNGLIDTNNKNANNTLHGIPLEIGMKGDSRSVFYCQKKDIRGLTYATQTSFGGQNNYLFKEAGVISNTTLFPDAYYDSENYGLDVRGCTATPSRGMRYPGEYGYVKWDNPEGVLSQNLEEASGNMKSQYYVTQSEDDAERYFQPISNKGYFTSLGELGNVFDPAQWRHVRRPTRQEAGATVDDALYASDDYTRNPEGEMMSAVELGEYGGGITLAIGSPEFHCFASPEGEARQGYEAARLLDQFRVTESPIRSLKSRINLNTAPRSVLLALFSGFLHEQDQIIGAFVRQPRNSTGDVASGLADGIIAARQKRPFLSLSDISLAKAPFSEGEGDLPIFGEKARFESNGEEEHGFGIHQQLWSDQGREELFRRMSDLFTTQSRSYRIHIQVENTKAGTESVVRKSFDVTLHPYLNNDLTVDTSRFPQVKIHKTTLK